jgi:hypothetical protein
MMMAQERLILKAQQQFEQIQDVIRQACSESRRIDQVELDLWGRMLQLGRRLLEGYVAGYEQGDVGATLEHEGRVLRRLEQPHVRRYTARRKSIARDHRASAGLWAQWNHHGRTVGNSEFCSVLFVVFRRLVFLPSIDLNGR